MTAFDGEAVIDSFRGSAFQARNLARAADIFAEMLADPECTVILTLAGSLVSAGLKEALLALIERDMADVIVATGAIVVDQDFFEALGFRHYRAPGSPDAPAASDEELGALGIDRIYDTYIREADLQRCDETVAGILDGLDARPHSSREIVAGLGAWLEANRPRARSIVLEAHRRDVPVFVPALSDSSAGFGAVLHRVRTSARGAASMSFDSAKDFHELAEIKRAAAETGLLMVGGGVPKNFAQDAVVAARMLADGGLTPGGREPRLHKYAVQLTVADVRDGGLSGSTLREASTWGKVETSREQMVFGEATITLSLLASDACHRGAWRGRSPRRAASVLAGGDPERPAAPQGPGSKP